MTTHRIGYISLAALLLLGAGCVPPQPSTSRTNANVSAVVPPPSEAQPVTGLEPVPDAIYNEWLRSMLGWKTYESEDLGLSIQYPENWSATSSNAGPYNPSILSFQPKEILTFNDKRFRDYGNTLHFRVAAYTPEKGKTVAMVLDDVRQSHNVDPGYNTVRQIGTVNVGTYQYLMRIFGGELENTQEYWIAHGGRAYVFEIYNPPSLPLCDIDGACLQMLESVRFTD